MNINVNSYRTHMDLHNEMNSRLCIQASHWASQTTRYKHIVRFVSYTYMVCMSIEWISFTLCGTQTHLWKLTSSNQAIKIRYYYYLYECTKQEVFAVRSHAPPFTEWLNDGHTRIRIHTHMYAIRRLDSATRQRGLSIDPSMRCRWIIIIFNV